MTRNGMTILSTVHNDYCRVLNGALPMLEPCAVKAARRVLRGGWDHKILSLPDTAGSSVALIAASSVAAAGYPWR